MILPGALGAAAALVLLDGQPLLPLVGWIAAGLLFLEAGMLRILRRLRARRRLDPDLQAEADRILAAAEAQTHDARRLLLDGAALVALVLLLPLELALLLAAAATARVLLLRLP